MNEVPAPVRSPPLVRLAAVLSAVPVLFILVWLVRLGVISDAGLAGRLAGLGLGLFFGGCLLAVATGLWRGRRWARWAFTVFAGGLLVHAVLDWLLAGPGGGLLLTGVGQTGGLYYLLAPLALVWLPSANRYFAR